VAHPAAAAGVLEVDRRDGRSLRAATEAEVRLLGVAVDHGAPARAGQRTSERGRGGAQRWILDRRQLVHPRGEVPVAALRPEALGRLAEEPGVELGEPGQARVQLGSRQVTTTGVEAGGVEILEDEEP